MEKERKTRKFKTDRDPKADPRKYYTIFFEIGLIITLSVFIGLTQIDFAPSDDIEYALQTQDVVEMEEIIQTEQKAYGASATTRPPVPVAVPNDVIMEEVDIAIDAELKSVGYAGYLPPPPKNEAGGC